MRTYAVGDIHGQLSELERAHALIAADRARVGDAQAPVVHVGDLCDRGPDARGVIARLMDGIASGAPWVVLKGNHDRMMSYYLEQSPRADPLLRADLDWLDPRLGGLDTLASYGVDVTRTGAALHAEARARVPEAHRRFLAALPNHYRRGTCFFCHAGIRPGVALDAQVEDDLIWIRAPFLTATDAHPGLIVHGHTPVDAATHYGNRINLDSGAGYGRPISAVAIEGREAWLLTGEGRSPLPPGASSRA